MPRVLQPHASARRLQNSPAQAPASSSWGSGARDTLALGGGCGTAVAPVPGGASTGGDGCEGELLEPASSPLPPSSTRPARALPVCVVLRTASLALASIPNSACAELPPAGSGGRTLPAARSLSVRSRCEGGRAAGGCSPREGSASWFAAVGPSARGGAAARSTCGCGGDAIFASSLPPDATASADAAIAAAFLAVAISPAGWRRTASAEMRSPTVAASQSSQDPPPSAGALATAGGTSAATVLAARRYSRSARRQARQPCK